MIEIKGALGVTERIKRRPLGEVTKDVRLKECVCLGDTTIGGFRSWAGLVDGVLRQYP